MNTVGGRLIVMLLLIHAVLMPLLYVALSRVIENSLATAFVDDTRIYGRVFADNLESLDPDTSRSQIVTLLDSALLGGQSTYAAVVYGDQRITSSLLDAEDVERFAEDFEFGENDDETYYLSVPVFFDGVMGLLQLGMDEAPTRESFETIRQTILYILVAYLLVVLIAAAALSTTIVKPLRWLQQASRDITSGNVDSELRSDSTLVEIRDLSEDLELMRSNLVGINARLLEEIAEREHAEAEQEVLEKRLRHAQRLESLGTLAGGVAHEFNNVLQPMVLYTDLAIEDLPEGSSTAANLRRVMQLANRARGLSQQILTFGRQSDDWNFEVAKIGPVVEEALSMIRALLPATTDLRGNIESDVGRVRCDPAQIQQLLVNLCNNAFRAINSRSGHISVMLKEVLVPRSMANRHTNLDAGEYAVIEVADTGEGMDAESAERAFEPFYTTQPVGEGTGLGLSVVHGIVMRHSGEIVLESAPGEGTRIRIYLPVIDEVTAAYA